MVFEKTRNTLLSVAAVVGAITVIAGGYVFFKYNIWKPKVKVVSVDYDKGVATIIFRGKELNIYGDATILLGGDWGVRLGTNNKNKYDRIELVKKGMVYDFVEKA